MTSLSEVEAAYIQAKAAYAADPNEETELSRNTWETLVQEARNVVRDYLKASEGFTVKQREDIRLEHLGWKP